LLVDREQHAASVQNLNGLEKLSKIYRMLRKKKSRSTPIVCPNTECVWPQPETVIEMPYFLHRWKRETLDASQQFDPDLLEFCYSQGFNNTDVVFVLKSISNESLTFLGFNPAFAHPSDMMLENLLIPGSIVRPTMKQGDGSKRQTINQLTRVLSIILRYTNQIGTIMRNSSFEPAAMNNNTLPTTAGPGWSAELDNQMKSLFMLVSNYMSNKKVVIPFHRMKPHDAKVLLQKESCIANSYKNGKKGRVRGNLMGKRVDFCIRTVVTPLVGYDLDEIGIPEGLANIVTVPVAVTRYNVEELQYRLCSTSDIKQIIVDPNNRLNEMIEVNERNKKQIQLRIGYVVERVLQNGDYVAVNRQPTLHRLSFMAHRVVIVQGWTIRLNMGASPPYNCDCDGDELNIHVPQTLAAQAELAELLAAHNNVLHPGANRPVFGLIQDDLAAAHMLSLPSTWLTQEDMLNLLNTCVFYDPKMLPEISMSTAAEQPHKVWNKSDLPLPADGSRWSGKQLVSMLLPPICMRRATSAGKEELLIDHGQLLSGVLCKKTLGVAAHSIIHQIAIYFGGGAACRFLSDLQRLTCEFFSRMGFSIGTHDCILDSAEDDAQLTQVVTDIYEHVEEIQSQAKRTKLLAKDDPVWQQRVEYAKDMAVVDTVRTALDTSGGIITNAIAPQANALKFMTTEAASKGSVLNTTQIMGCLGQTFVGGVRPGGVATMLAERMFPTSPLLPHAAAAARRLNSNLTVPESDDVRLQLRCAGFIDRPYAAGLDVEQMFTHAMGGREGLIDTANKTKVTGYMARRVCKAMEALVVQYDNTVRSSQAIYTLRVGGDGYEAGRLFILNKLDLCMAANDVLEANGHHHRLLFSVDEMKRVRDIIRASRMNGLTLDVLSSGLGAALPFNLETLVPPAASIRTHKCQCYTANENLDTMFVDDLRRFVFNELSVTAQAHIMWWLRPSVTNYCNKCLACLLDRMRRLHERALLQPGEAIGVTAATSISEPATQLTLNTFHFAGVVSAGITYGIVRLCELVDSSANARSPFMLVPLLPGTTQQEARDVAAEISSVTLLSVLTDAGIYRNIPPTTLNSNPGVREFLKISKEKFLPFSLRLTVHPSVRINSLIKALQDFVGTSALILCDHFQDNTIHLLFVNNTKLWQKMLTRAMSSVPTRVTQRTMRPVALRPANQATDIARKVPIQQMCRDSVMCHDRVDEDSETPVDDVIALNLVREAKARILAKCRLQGIPGVTAVNLQAQKCTTIDSKTGALVNEDRFVLDIRGVGLNSIYKLPFVDMVNVVSNNVHEVYDTLGIDAAAHVLFHEIRTCFEVGGARTDDRLISLLVQVITQWGDIMALTRHGINRLHESHQSAVAKISFEEVLDMIHDACTTGQRDPLLGPSEVVMFGKRLRAGTGLAEMISTAETDDSNEVVVSNVPTCSTVIISADSQHKNKHHQPLPQQHVFAQQLTTDLDIMRQCKSISIARPPSPARDVW
jgi:DNA-directed RNA polymerase II subunit RPB1